MQSNYEAMNCLKLGIEKSKFQGREDTMKLIEALEGLEMKEGDDFPQGDKLLRKEDHQAFVRSSSSRSRAASTRSGRDPEGQDPRPAGLQVRFLGDGRADPRGRRAGRASAPAGVRPPPLLRDREA